MAAIAEVAAILDLVGSWRAPAGDRQRKELAALRPATSWVRCHSNDIGGAPSFTGRACGEGTRGLSGGDLLAEAERRALPLEDIVPQPAAPQIDDRPAERLLAAA